MLVVCASFHVHWQLAGDEVSGLLRYGGGGIQIGTLVGAVGCFVLNVKLGLFNTASYR